ncbi:UDP-glucosyltransferase, putative [Medicago truncatula]|uniref:UDP-glucosyltransferase, putative n=2 Tax=Medicago truncatula TaxID=3880 RepID=A0A072UT46_MEDTR|nr:UDP-glucosyltransferase, putative [Medicago truncatula]
MEGVELCLRPVANKSQSSPLPPTPTSSPISLLPLPIPSSFAFIPSTSPPNNSLLDGVESLSSTTDIATSAKIYYGAMLLHGPIQDFMEKDPPDCIITDCIYPWVYDLGHKLQIPTIAFTGFSIFTVSLMESLRINPSLKSHTDLDLFVVPNFPHSITLCTKPPKSFTGFMEMVHETMLKTNGLIVNNFAELDGEECIEHYEKTTGHKAWHLGPVSLIRKSVQEKAERGHESVVGVQECLWWLNSKRHNSVLYMMTLALEYDFSVSGNFPIKGKLFSEGKGSKFWRKKLTFGAGDPERRWETIKTHIRLPISWVGPTSYDPGPHSGGCVYDALRVELSTIEAGSAGIPMITWPVHGEQFYNEKLITDVRGIGIEVGATEWCVDGIEERNKVINKDNIEKAVRKLMDGGDEAEDIRRRAREFGDKAI